MNKKDYIVDYINSLLIPYVCIVYTDIEIENIVSFNDKIKDNLDDTIIKTRVIEYIKNITWNYMIYILSTLVIIKLLMFINSS